MRKRLCKSLLGLMILSVSATLQGQLVETSQSERELIVLIAPGAENATPEKFLAAAKRLEATSPLTSKAPLAARYLIRDRDRVRSARVKMDALGTPKEILQRYLVLTFEPGVDLASVTADLRKRTEILHVGPNRRFRLSSTPNDPLFSIQWGLQSLGLPTAWDGQKGHAYISVIDTGIDTDHSDHVAFDSTGTWMGGNYRDFLSHDYGANDPNPDEGQEQPAGCSPGPGCLVPPRAGHGTHVAGIAAANSANGEGVAGVCQDCSLMLAKAAHLAVTSQGNVFYNITQADTTSAIDGSVNRGSQVINLSLGWRRTTDTPGCGPLAPDCQADPLDSFCQAVELAHDRDVVIAAASGNDGSSLPDFPASDSRVLGAAGIRADGQFWNDCSAPSCECGGSNYDPTMFNLPATAIPSTFYVGLPYQVATDPIPEVTCADSTLPDDDGYGFCTGTSMAAPHLAGIAGILRSANPLLSTSDIESLLVANLDNRVDWNPAFGRGKPDAAAALDDALGMADGVVLANRLTPLFHLYSSEAETHLVTTVPQMASAALTDDEVEYFLRLGIPETPGYNRFPGTTCSIGPCTDTPRAHVYLFTSDTPPFPGASLVPLYRMGFDESFGGNPLNRSFFYTTETAGLELGKSGGYSMIGIEGYIHERCTPEPSCIPPGATRLYRLYHQDRDDYVVIPESQVSNYQSQGYVFSSSLNDWIGYVYENIDSDFDHVIDGFESLIGTDPLSFDSDNDGLSDGEEILQYPYSDPLGQVIGEVGTVSVNHVATTVTLSRSYSNPVVIAQPPSFNGNHPVVVRLSNISNDQFTLAVHEPPNRDNTHAFETVSYLVLEAGGWQLANGARLEVGSVSTSATVGKSVPVPLWEQVSYPAFTTTPVVLSQVQTNFDPHWVKTRQNNVTTTGFDVALEEEEAATDQHGTESIGWVAIEPSQGSWSGHPFEAANTGNVVKAALYTLDFAVDLGASPRFLASMASFRGRDNSALRQRNLGATSVQVNIEEENTLDEELGHIAESVAYIAIGSDGTLNAIPSP